MCNYLVVREVPETARDRGAGTGVSSHGRRLTTVALLAGCASPLPPRVASYGPFELRCDHQRYGCRVPPATVLVVHNSDSATVTLVPPQGYTLPIHPLRCGESPGECTITATEIRDDQATRIELSTNAVAGPLRLRLHWVSCDVHRCVVDDGVLAVKSR